MKESTWKEQVQKTSNSMCSVLSQVYCVTMDKRLLYVGIVIDYVLAN